MPRNLKRLVFAALGWGREKQGLADGVLQFDGSGDRHPQMGHYHKVGLNRGGVTGHMADGCKGYLNDSVVMAEGRSAIGENNGSMAFILD